MLSAVLGSEQQNYVFRLLSPENLPSILLFVVGVGGIYVAVRTLKHIARQADLMDRQTAHLINSERAWVTDTVIWGGGPPQLFKMTDASGEHTSTVVDLFWNNHGKTPAWVSEAHIKMEVTSAGPSPTPDLAGAEVFYGPVPVIPGNPPRKDGHRFDLSCKGFANEKPWMTLIYGVIKYRDVFTPAEKTWETWFGYRVVANHGLERLAHPEYNKHL